MSEQEQAVQAEQATQETFLGSEGGSDNLDWKSTLPEDLRDNPTLSNFKDVASLAKTVVHQQQQMGSRIPMPKTEEEFSELYTKLGRPAEASEYQYNVPDGMDEYFGEQALGEFGQVAHKIGLNQQQVDALIEYQAGAIGSELENEPAFLAQQMQQTQEQLKSEWGLDYDKNVRAARRALEVYGDPEIAELMNTSAGNHPAVVKLFARLGAEITEDMAQNTQRSNVAVSPLDARAEIDATMANPNHPYFNDKSPDHRTAIERMRQLHEKVYGN